MQRETRVAAWVKVFSDDRFEGLPNCHPMQATLSFAIALQGQEKA